MSLFRMILRSKKPTHVMTVGQSDSGIYGMSRSSYGAINPATVSGEGLLYNNSVIACTAEIQRLRCSGDITRVKLEFAKASYPYSTYLTIKRLDTGVVFAAASDRRHTYEHDFDARVALFTAEDVGKRIPLEITMEARQ